MVFPFELKWLNLFARKVFETEIDKTYFAFYKLLV